MIIGRFRATVLTVITAKGDAQQLWQIMFAAEDGTGPYHFQVPYSDLLRYAGKLFDMTLTESTTGGYRVTNLNLVTPDTDPNQMWQVTFSAQDGSGSYQKQVTASDMAQFAGKRFDMTFTEVTN